MQNEHPQQRAQAFNAVDEARIEHIPVIDHERNRWALRDGPCVATGAEDDNVGCHQVEALEVHMFCAMACRNVGARANDFVTATGLCDGRSEVRLQCVVTRELAMMLQPRA